MRMNAAEVAAGAGTRSLHTGGRSGEGWQRMSME